MSVVVSEDAKGRLLLPVEIRRRVRAKRFRVTMRGETIELQPVASLRELKGKYRDVIKGDWEELEEKGEEFAASGKR